MELNDKITEFELVDLSEISSIEKLKELLSNFFIPINEWGQGEAKTLQHLFNEILDGETVLVRNEDGEIMRQVKVGRVDIKYYHPSGEQFRLRELKQVFKDGRERTRKLVTSLGEKIKAGEDPDLAITRGIQEELGIEGELDLSELEIQQEVHFSQSYPGLASQYVFPTYEVFLKDEQYKPEGYIEEQPDKSTYFIWEEF